MTIGPRCITSAAMAVALTVSVRGDGAASPDYAPVLAMLKQFIAHERTAKGIDAVSIALVDGDEIVWATGMGFARPADSVPATATTRYRVGGVSQILTAIAVMQLVEQRLVQLDAPVTRYVASFGPRNPGGDVTLRQLLAHHSGLLREPPLGGAVDPFPPSLAATVASLNRIELAYPPGSHEKYSNAGAALAGYVIERVTRTPFPEAMARQVLAPVGMAASAFHAPGAADPGLAHGVMWAHDGRRFAAPTFQLGTGPAVELHTTVIDLARLLTVLFQDGRTPDGTPLLRRESLARLWTPQFTSARATAGAGLGFVISRWEGHRRVGHDGAVYGFATELGALPDERLGVVVVATLDGANSVTARIADAALRGMLAARAGRPVPEPETADPVPPERAARAAGRYVHRDRRLELRHRPAGLFLAGASGVGLAVGARGDTLVVDDAVDWGLRLLPLDSTGSRLLVAGDTYAAAALPRPEPAADRWRGLVGEYGWDHDVLFVYEAQGTLYGLIDWFFPYALREIARDTFAFPEEGRYRGERLVFARDAADGATEVVAGGVRFARRAVGPGNGGQLRVTPLAPVPEILAAARAAQPPPQPDSLRAPALTDLAALDSTIRLDVRYATSNNFLGSPFYASARVFLQRPAAEAVVRAHRRLRQRGYGLLIHDGYRPWYVTRAFWDATPPASRWMVANPASGSRHNRGCAVDLTLFDLATGAVVDMGGTYDETTPRSYPDYPVTTALQRWHREVLREALEREGFRRVADEWWHFDYHDWRAYPILNLPFEELR